LLRGAPLTACEIADLGQFRGTEVGDRAVLEVVPVLLDRIEFAGLAGQELDLHLALLYLEPGRRTRPRLCASKPSQTMSRGRPRSWVRKALRNSTTCGAPMVAGKLRK
jgi:hypothetical protein